MLPFLAQAWQSWKSARATASLVVLALAVGIGSATAIYGVVHSLLLKPLPYANGERWVSVLGASHDDPKSMSSLNFADLQEYQQRSRSFDAFGWMDFTDFNLTSPGQPQYLKGVRVTPQLANSLGVAPRIGRWFQNLSSGPVAVLSDALWRSLGADPNILGKTVTMNGYAYTVTGVMPPGFNLPLAGAYGDVAVQVWIPLDPSGAGQQRDAATDFGYARLRAGVTAAQADAEIKQLAREIAQRQPLSRQNYTARVDGLQQLITKEIRPVLLLLFGAALLLMLITCANVAGLLLARSVARARETAVRVALGASLPQLGFQYFLEGLLVSIPGAVAGVLFAFLLLRFVVTYGGAAVTRVTAISMDWPVIAFAIAITFAACALTSMAPLWQAARTLPNDVLSEGVRASAGARSRRLSSAFVISEIALAFVLLAASSAMIAELYALARISPGFDPDHLLTFTLTIAPESIPGKAGYHAYLNRLIDTVRSVPGVSGVGVSNQIPLDGCCFSTSIYQEGQSARPSTGESVAFLPVNGDYFRTMGIPLRRGRLFNEHDTDEKQLLAVINQAAARRYWPDREPLGAYGHFSSPKGDRFQIIGVVGDVKNEGLDRPTVPEIYLNAAIVPFNPINFVVRSAVPPASLVPAVRTAIQRTNAQQPIHDVALMSDVARRSVSLKTASSFVMLFFALAALVMATIGTYGVVSYSVRQRTVELGTRMALGATAGDLLRLVMGAGLRMAAYGVVIGGVVSAGAMWLLAQQLRAVAPGVLPFLIPAVTVAVIALASSLFPAWRATLLSPMVAIRNEPGSMWQSTRLAIDQLFERWGVDAHNGGDLPSSPDAGMMTALIEASRNASGFREAIHAALDALRTNLGAETALLLEANGSGELRATAASPDHSAVDCIIPAAGMLVSRLRAYGAALPISPEDLNTGRRWAAEAYPTKLAEIDALASTGARLAVALRTNKEVLGVLLLGEPSGREQYSRTDKRVLRGSADQFALLLENARLTNRVVEQEKVLRDVALAAEVQRRLLPRQGMDTLAATLTGLNLPARSVGGDYYDFLELEAGHIGIALADVAGKGIPAALIMSVVQASLRVISAEPQITLPQLAAKMNYFLYRSTGPQSYATFFYACLDPATRELRYVNAGHNAPYLLRATSEIEELTTGGTIIGMFPQARYDEGSVALNAGDVLIVFSDGVTEALNPQEEEYGDDRLKTLLREVAPLEVEAMAERIRQDLIAWIQDAPQYDDLTFLLLKAK